MEIHPKQTLSPRVISSFSLRLISSLQVDSSKDPMTYPTVRTGHYPWPLGKKSRPLYPIVTTCRFVPILPRKKKHNILLGIHSPIHLCKWSDSVHAFQRLDVYHFNRPICLWMHNPLPCGNTVAILELRDHTKKQNCLHPKIYMGHLSQLFITMSDSTKASV